MLRKREIGESVFLLVLSAVLVTLFSTCSPLYPINPWDDANVFMTIGKAMLRGKVLYRDIFDHKGPVLFFMHELAAAVSYTSFFGIYLMEILGMWGFALCGLKTMRLFSRSRINAPLLCLLMLLTVTSDAFYYGDSAEEFCLPILAYTLFLMLRFVRTHRAPRRHQSLLLGLGAGIVFWTKFNILVFFYGGSFVALVYIVCREGRFRQFCSILSWMLAGFCMVSAGVMAYFIAHGAVGSLADAYFCTNLTKYAGVSSNGEPAVWWFILVKIAIMAVLLLPVILAKVRRNVKLLVLGSYGALLLSFTFLTVQFYYFLLLYVYAPLFIVYFRRREPGVRVYAGMVAVAAGAVMLNWNLATLAGGTFSHLTLDVAEIVNRNTTADSQVMNFASYDTGVFLKTRHLPPSRHFFISNIEDEETREEQRALVCSGRIRYLVREVVPVRTSHDFYDMPLPDSYRLVYCGEEPFRYRFYTRPHQYLWNLEYLRPLLGLFIHPRTEPRRMLLYERMP